MYEYLLKELYQSQKWQMQMVANNANRKVIFESCTLFSKCISEINMT